MFNGPVGIAEIAAIKQRAAMICEKSETKIILVHFAN